MLLDRIHTTADVGLHHKDGRRVCCPDTESSQGKQCCGRYLHKAKDDAIRKYGAQEVPVTIVISHMKQCNDGIGEAVPGGHRDFRLYKGALQHRDLSWA